MPIPDNETPRRHLRLTTEAERPNEPTHRQANLGGDTVHYWVYHADEGAAAPGDSGSTKPTIVMLHGFRGTHHGLEQLTRHLGDFQVVIPDLPGFGDSAPRRFAAHELADYVDTARALLRHLSAEHVSQKPFVVFGHSAGSIVASHLASSSPELVESLVLLNPIATPALSGPRAALSRITAMYYGMARRLPNRMAYSLLASTLVTHLVSTNLTRTRDPQLRKDIRGYHHQHFNSFHDPSVLDAMFRWASLRTVAEVADQLTMPTLLIAGTEDDLAPVAGQHRLREKLPNGQLVLLAGVGHLIHYEMPQRAASAIRSFIA